MHPVPPRPHTVELTALGIHGSRRYRFVRVSAAEVLEVGADHLTLRLNDLGSVQLDARTLAGSLAPRVRIRVSLDGLSARHRRRALSAARDARGAQRLFEIEIAGRRARATATAPYTIPAEGTEARRAGHLADHRGR
jgi:hypothetical protein